MRFGRGAIGAVAAVGIAVPLAFGVAGMAVGDETRQALVRTVDLDELTSGAAPRTPYLTDGAIRTPEGEIPVDAELNLSTYAAIGRSGFVAIDDTSGDGMNNRLVRIDRDGVREYAAGHVVRPFALSSDRKRLAWAEWDGWKGKLVLADAATGEIERKRPIDQEMYTTGFVGESVVLRPASGGAARIWTSGEGIRPIAGSLNATATDPRRGLVSVITRYEDDPDSNKPLACSTVLDTDADDRELWESCDAVPVSFSPDGRYVWARDTRTDDALPTTVFLLDARTGEELFRLDHTPGTTQRVNWESDGTVVLDAWDDDRMALVRCDLAADGDCELATDVKRHDDPVMEPPMPYLLPDQP